MRIFFHLVQNKSSLLWHNLFSACGQLFHWLFFFCPPSILPSVCVSHPLPKTPLLYIDFCIADVPEPCSSGAATEESQPKFGLPASRAGEHKQQSRLRTVESQIAWWGWWQCLRVLAASALQQGWTTHIYCSPNPWVGGCVSAQCHDKFMSCFTCNSALKNTLNRLSL